MLATAAATSGSGSRERVGEHDLDLDPVCRRVPPSRLDCSGSLSRATTGANPSLAAAIASTPDPQPTSSSEPAVERQQKLEAEPRRGVRAGAEGAARIDHDRERVRGRGLPRRPQPERPDPHRPVEAPPPILPAGLDLVDHRALESRRQRARRRRPARAHLRAHAPRTPRGTARSRPPEPLRPALRAPESRPASDRPRPPRPCPGVRNRHEGWHACSPTKVAARLGPRRPSSRIGRAQPSS